jgi:hypothetical protein
MGTHDVAVFDLNGDGWKDLVLGRCNVTRIWINQSPCPADIAGSPSGPDQTVDIDDLLALLNAWGATGGPPDITQDGTVDVEDLLAVIASWGICP